jgi:hypothetical protein
MTHRNNANKRKYYIEGENYCSGANKQITNMTKTK